MDKGKKKKHKNKKHRALKIVLVVLVIVLVLCAGALGAAYYMLGNLNTVDFTESDADLGIDESNGSDEVVNIALYGVDTRDFSKDTGLSDAIIVMSVDQKNNVIKMTSILRDSKVPIEGHGSQKINHAYSYGGPVLAMKTLNQNFGLDIKEYVTVNFSQLADIVDAVGGVTLNLTDEEVRETNINMADKFADEPKVQSSGEVLLTGAQAVSYSRIRKIDSDNMRASRQQNVLNAVFEKIKTMSKSEYPGFIRKFLGIVETSLSYSDLMALAPIAMHGFTIENYTIPDAEFETDLWGGIDETGAWVWTYDIGAAANRLHNIIYGEDYTAPTTDTTTPETGTENSVVDNSAQTQPAETPPAEDNASNNTTTGSSPKQGGVTVDQMMQ